MTFKEITEAKPVKPLTPKQARSRAAKVQTAQAKLQDLKTMNAVRVQAQQRKIAAI